MTPESAAAPGRSTLRRTMAAALRRVPDELADDPARAALMAMADALPEDLIEGPLGLEFRLAGPRTVDVFASAVPRRPSFQALCAALRTPLHVTGWEDPARAADLAEVLERWVDGTGALPLVARYLLVEVDAPARPGDALAVPSIFLAPRAPRDVVRPGQPPNAFQQRTEATTVAVAELSGVWPDPGTATAFAAVVDSLPSEADVFAVGAMVSRQAGSSMRVAVRRLDPEGIQRVLTGIGRARQADVIAAWADASPSVEHVIAFEVGPGAEARVGLELSPEHDWKEARLDGWPELLDFLAGTGLARPERLAAVPGLVDADGDPVWGLAHVKVAADGAGPIPASKLYVGFIARGAMPKRLVGGSRDELGKRA